MKPELLSDAMTGLLTHLDLTEDQVLSADIDPYRTRIKIQLTSRALDTATAIADRTLDDATYNPVAHTTDDGTPQIHHQWAGTWTTPTGDTLRVEVVTVEPLKTSAGGVTP